MEIMKKSQFNTVVSLPTVATDRRYASDDKIEAVRRLRESGMSIHQVSKVLHVSHHSVMKWCPTTDEMRKVADEKRLKAIKQKYEERLEYYIPIMRELRNAGYSNMDISKKTGFNHLTVWKYIGSQPDEITLASMRAAGAKIRFRNLAAKNQPCRDEGKPIPAVAEALKTA